MDTIFPVVRFHFRTGRGRALQRIIEKKKRKKKEKYSKENQAQCLCNHPFYNHVKVPTVPDLLGVCGKHTDVMQTLNLEHAESWRRVRNELQCL